MFSTTWSASRAQMRPALRIHSDRWNTPSSVTLSAPVRQHHWPRHQEHRPPKRLHIMHVAVEMAPIAKVGGLGDVVTSLSRAVQELGHNVEIILPKYGFLVRPWRPA